MSGVIWPRKYCRLVYELPVTKKHNVTTSLCRTETAALYVVFFADI
jgi:hypothetical protein